MQRAGGRQASQDPGPTQLSPDVRGWLLDRDCRRQDKEGGVCVWLTPVDPYLVRRLWRAYRCLLYICTLCTYLGIFDAETVHVRCYPNTSKPEQCFTREIE